MTISLSIPLVISWSVSLLLLCVLLVVLILRKRNRHEQSSRDTGELQGRLNELEKISSHIDELRSLFILPRTRGDVGEKLLGELLHNWLPQDAFSLQYGFKDGTRADAFIFIVRHSIALDAK